MWDHEGIVIAKRDSGMQFLKLKAFSSCFIRPRQLSAACKSHVLRRVAPTSDHHIKRLACCSRQATTVVST
jgi:hypothetical protein